MFSKELSLWEREAISAQIIEIKVLQSESMQTLKLMPKVKWEVLRLRATVMSSSKMMIFWGGVTSIYICYRMEYSSHTRECSGNVETPRDWVWNVGKASQTSGDFLCHQGYWMGSISWVLVVLEKRGESSKWGATSSNQLGRWVTGSGNRVSNSATIGNLVHWLHITVYKCR